MPVADPPPAKPQVALPSDVRNYALWLERQVLALDASVKNYIGNPQQPLSQREAVLFVVTVGKGMSWNKWLLGWHAFLASAFDITIPGLGPIKVPVAALDWGSVERYHTELEHFRATFKDLGVPVPDATEKPKDGEDPFAGLGQLGIGLGVVAGVGLLGYLVWKYG